MIVLLFLLFDQFLIDPLRHLVEAEQALQRWQFALLILDVLIVTVIGYWLNDHYDRKVDAINRPDRFLVRFRIAESQFSSWVFSLLAVGVIITIYLAIEADKLNWIWIYPLTIALLWRYAKNGKRWGIWGNILVSICIASIPLLFLLAEQSLITELRANHEDNYNRFILVLSLFTLLMFLLNLSREIVKDLQDMTGDAVARSTSIPLLVGIARTKTIIVFVLALSASVQWSLFFVLINSQIVFTYSVLVSILLLFTVVRLMKADTSAGFGRGSLMLKILMIFGLFELIFIPIA